MTPGSPHRAWVEINHAAIRANLEVIRRAAGGAQVIGVVKANAYGHGAVAVARTLVAAGIERLAVATIDEAVELREAGVTAPLLLLWGIGPREAGAVMEHGLEPIVYDAGAIDALEAAAAARRVRIGVHLKVDTGLGRQGATSDDAADLGDPHRAQPVAAARRHHEPPGRAGRGRRLHGGPGPSPGARARHDALGRHRPRRRAPRRQRGLLAGGAPFADAVRPGLALYGLVPDWARQRDPGLQPALSLRALPLRIFDLAAGEGIGYGLRFRATRDTRIATLGIGYGDGWPRAHANNGWVLVRGRPAPIVGAISMDGLTVEVGGIDGVTYGDEFVLIGEQGGARITADDVAAERRTINYEVTTALRDRLPRLHRGVD